MWMRVTGGRDFNFTKICKGKEEKRDEEKKRLLAESMSTKGGMLR